MTVLTFRSKEEYLATLTDEPKAQNKPVATPTIKAATPQPKATAAPVVTPQPKMAAPQAAARKITPKKGENVTCRKCKRFSSDGHCTYGGWRVISPDRVRNCEHYEL